MHWRGSWLDFDRGWELACRGSGGREANALCGWLPAHVSYEFATYLPMGILECYGYRFPRPYPQWEGWKAKIPLRNQGRFGLLEVDFADSKDEEGAIRFSTFAPGHDDATDELPPLTAMAPLLPRPGS